ncbi:MAG: pimeloyl-ACP methyl ester esterase BioH [Betaproteobacteria bacterium]
MSLGAPSSAKPDLALIHGWGIGQAAWQPLAEALAPFCCVHYVNLPGYGSTPASQASFQDTAQAMLEALPEGSILCGWSLGGLLALQAAILAPQRINGLILIGASPSFTQHDNWLHAQTPALLETFTAAVSQDPATTLQRFIALLNQGDAKARSAIRALAQALATTPLPDTASLVQGLGWLRDIDLRDQLAGLTIPALLIHGENDPLMPLAAAQWLQQTLNTSQLEIIPGAAHAPFINAPERIAKLIGDYCHASAIHQATRPRVV